MSTTSHGQHRSRNSRLAAALTGLLVAAALLAQQQPVGAAATAPSEVRVDQVGYAQSAFKRAYLMTAAPLPGAWFLVEDSQGIPFYAAQLGADQGAWSSAYQHVYTLDFSALRTAGTYHIVVPAAHASSPAFRVDTPGKLYAQALANSLSFYENERDGPDFIPSALRTEPAHLDDEDAMTYLIPQINSNDGFSGDLTPLGIRIDASGGWWDAGDYLKFVETTSYVVGMMETGIRDFPGQLGPGSSTANYTAEAQFGLDWLSRMWDDQTRTLYIEVGIAEGNDKIVGDHDIWRLPQADDTYGGNDPEDRYIRDRPVFRAGPPGSLISPNLAGRLAADFALCYQLEHVTEPALADRCLLSAEHIFDLADTHPGQLQTAIAYDFYPEVEWRDDMEWGATELYDALHDGGAPSSLPHRDADYYLKAAAHWAHAYITGPNDAADTLNLYDVSGLAHFELYRALQGTHVTGLEVTSADLAADMNKQLQRAASQSAQDPFGFGFPWDQFDTTSHGAGLAVMAAEYDWMTGSQRYAGYGVDQLNNILGANAWGVSLIVGDGSTYPDCMQHQVANLAGSLNGRPPILAGAAVEGPNSFSVSGVVQGMRLCPANGVDKFAPFNNSQAVFQDNVQSWSTDEPALDLTVSSPLAFAWQVSGPRAL